jgi:hypothetical protein
VGSPSGPPRKKSNTRAPRRHRRGFARRQPGTVTSRTGDDTSQTPPTSSSWSLNGPPAWMTALVIPTFR